MPKYDDVADCCWLIPGLVATSVYGQPVLLMMRFEKLATPWLAWTCVVPDRVTGFEFGLAPMFRVITAFELLTTVVLSPASTSTETGLVAADWPICEVIGDPATPPAGSFWNASEQLPVTAAARGLPVVSSTKSLPDPLNWFDCLAWTLHAEAAALHGAVASTVSVACWPGELRPRFRNSAEVAVYEAAPGAPVTTKPTGAVIWMDPSVCVVASLVTVNVKAWLRP